MKERNFFVEKFAILSIFVSCFFNANLMAQPELVKDIVPGSASSNPASLTNVNGKLWFFVTISGTSYLYKSDGTEPGTVALVTMPQNTNGNAKAFNNKMTFSCFTPGYGYEPWITDGTAAGTFMIKDLYPGTGGSGATMMGSLGTTAFLFGSKSNIGNDLGIFKTDGTTVGTSLMFTVSGMAKAISFKNKMYFWGTFGGVSGLYSFDANSTSPTLMAQHVNFYYDFAYAVGTNLFYYVANTALYGNEPWVSDGTAAGTKMLKDIMPGTASSVDDGSSSSFTSMVILNDKLYFNPFENTYGRELWVSDGTTANTTLFKDLEPGSGNGNPKKLLVAGDKIFFDKVLFGTDYLWVIDETANAQMRIDRDDNNVEVSGLKYKLNDKVFFAGTTSYYAIGIEPYISNGSKAGTYILKNINPANYDNSISTNTQHIPVVIGSTVFFIANDGTTGLELWKYTDTTSVLPLTFISLSANQIHAGVQVNWKVAEEMNIRSYDIERSNDGRSFTSMGTIPARGNSSLQQNYGWVDLYTPSSSLYYRIKSISISGEIKYSGIVKVAMGKGFGDFTIAPNPVEGGMINLHFKNQEKGKYLVRLVNTKGQTIFIKAIEHSGGNGLQYVQLPPSISKGNYIVEIIAQDKTTSRQKIIVNNR